MNFSKKETKKSHSPYEIETLDSYLSPAWDLANTLPLLNWINTELNEVLPLNSYIVDLYSPALAELTSFPLLPIMLRTFLTVIPVLILLNSFKEHVGGFFFAEASEKSPVVKENRTPKTKNELINFFTLYTSFPLYL